MEQLDKISNFKNKLAFLETNLHEIEMELSDVKALLNDTIKKKEYRLLALEVTKKMLEKMNESTVNVFSNFVTSGLRAIFSDEQYSVKFEIDDRGKNKCINILFNDGIHEEWTKLNRSIGGGVQVIIGLLLQIVLLKVFEKRMFLLLDESLVQVSKQYIPTLMAFIKDMTKEYGLTTLVVTHVDLSEYADISYEMKSGVLSQSYMSSDIPKDTPKIIVNTINFQNITKAEAIIQGVTIITGPSNNGKSAFLRSIIYALTNENGSDFIQYGKKKSLVGMKFEGFQNNSDVLIKWTKTQTTAKFEATVDGKTEQFEKLGRGKDAVVELMSPYNLHGVELGDLYLNPNFWLQMDKPLTTLLDGKTDLFKLFNGLSQTEKILEANNSLKEELSNLEDEIKSATASHDLLQNKIFQVREVIEEMQEDFPTIIEIESALKNLNSKMENLKNYNSAIESRKLAKSKLTDLEDGITIFKRIKGIGSKYIELKSYSDMISNIYVMKTNMNILFDSAKHLTKMKEKVSELLELRKFKDCQYTITTNKDKLSLITEEVSSWNILKSKTLIYQHIINYKNGKQELDKLKHNRTLIINVVDSMKVLSDKVLVFLQLKKLKSSKEYINDTAISLNELNIELSEIDICPTCKQHATFTVGA